MTTTASPHLSPSHPPEASTPGLAGEAPNNFDTAAAAAFAFFGSFGRRGIYKDVGREGAS